MSNTVEVKIIGEESVTDEIAKVQAALNSLRDKTINVNIDVDKKKLKDSLNDAVDGINRNPAKKRVQLEVNKKTLENSIRDAVEGAVAKNGKSKVKVEVDDADAKRKFAEIKAAADAIGRDDVNVNADVDIASAMSKLAALQAAIDALEGGHVSIGANIDDSKIKSETKKARRKAQKEADKDSITVSVTPDTSSARDAIKDLTRQELDALKAREKAIAQQINRSSTRKDLLGFADRVKEMLLRVNVDVEDSKLRTLLKELSDNQNKSIHLDFDYDRAAARRIAKQINGDDAFDRITANVGIDVDREKLNNDLFSDMTDFVDHVEDITKRYNLDVDIVNADDMETLFADALRRGIDDNVVTYINRRVVIRNQIDDDLNRQLARLGRGASKELSDKITATHFDFDNIGDLTKSINKEIRKINNKGFEIDVKTVVRNQDIDRGIARSLGLNDTHETLTRYVNEQIIFNRDRNALGNLRNSVTSLDRLENSIISVGRGYNRSDVDRDRFTRGLASSLLVMAATSRGYTGIIGGTSNMLGRMTRGIPVIGGMFRLLGAVPKVAGFVTSAFERVGDAITKMGMERGSDAIAGFGSSLASLGKVAGPIAGVVAAVGAATVLFGALATAGVVGTSLITAGVYAVVGALGAVVGVSSAIGAAVGAGLVAPFIYFASKLPEVSNAFKTLGDTVNDEMTNISRVAAPALVRVADELGKGFQHVKPYIQQMANESANVLNTMASRLPSLAQSLGPAMSKAFSGGTKQLDLFASRLPGVVTAMGDLFGSLGSPTNLAASQKFWDAMPGTIKNVEKALQGASAGFSQTMTFLESPDITPFKEGFGSFFDELKNTDWSSATQGIKGAMNSLGDFVANIDGEDLSNFVGSFADGLANLTNIATDIDLMGIFADIAGAFEFLTNALNIGMDLSGLDMMIDGLGQLFDLWGAIPDFMKNMADPGFKEANLSMKSAANVIDDLRGSLQDADKPLGQNLTDSLDGIYDGIGKIGNASPDVANGIERMASELKNAANNKDRFSDNQLSQIFSQSEAIVNLVPKVNSEALKTSMLDQSYNIMVRADKEDLDGLLNTQKNFIDLVPRMDESAATAFSDAINLAAKFSPQIDKAGMEAFNSAATAMMKVSVETDFSDLDEAKLGESIKIFAEVIPRLSEAGLNDQIQQMSNAYKNASIAAPSLGEGLGGSREKLASALEGMSIDIQTSVNMGNVEAAKAQISTMDATMNIVANLKSFESAGNILDGMTAVVDVIPKVQAFDPGVFAAFNQAITQTVTLLPTIDPGAQANLMSNLGEMVKGVTLNIEAGNIQGALDAIKNFTANPLKVPTELTPPAPLPDGSLPPVEQPVVPKVEGEGGTEPITVPGTVKLDTGGMAAIPVPIIPQIQEGVQLNPIPVPIIPQIQEGFQLQPIPLPVIPQIQEGFQLQPIPLPVIPQIQEGFQLQPVPLPVIPQVQPGASLPPMSVEVIPQVQPASFNFGTATVDVVPNVQSFSIPDTTSQHHVTVNVEPYTPPADTISKHFVDVQVEAWTPPGDTHSTHTVHVVTKGDGTAPGGGGRRAFGGLFGGFGGGNASGLYGAAGASSSFRFSVESIKSSILRIAHDVEAGLRREYERLAKEATEALGTGLKNGMVKQAPKVHEGAQALTSSLKQDSDKMGKSGDIFETSIEMGEIKFGTQTFKATRKFKKDTDSAAKAVSDGGKNLSNATKSAGKEAQAAARESLKIGDTALKNLLVKSPSAWGADSETMDQIRKIGLHNRKVRELFNELKTGEAKGRPGEGRLPGEEGYKENLRKRIEALTKETNDILGDAEGQVDYSSLYAALEGQEEFNMSISLSGGGGGGPGGAMSKASQSVQQGAAEVRRTTKDAEDDIKDGKDDIDSALKELEQIPPPKVDVAPDVQGLQQLAAIEGKIEGSLGALSFKADFGIGISIPSTILPPALPPMPQLPTLDVLTALQPIPQPILPVIPAIEIPFTPLTVPQIVIPTPAPVQIPVAPFSFPPIQVPTPPPINVDIQANASAANASLKKLSKNIAPALTPKANTSAAQAQISQLKKNTSSTHTVRVRVVGDKAPGGGKSSFAGGLMAGLSGGLVGSAGATSFNYSSELYDSILTISDAVKSAVLSSWFSLGQSITERFNLGISSGWNSGWLGEFFSGIFGPGGVGGIGTQASISVYKDGQLVSKQFAEGIKDGNKYIVKAGDEFGDAVFTLPKKAEGDMKSVAQQIGELFTLNSIGTNGISFSFDLEGLRQIFEKQAISMSAGYLNEHGQFVVYNVTDQRSYNNNFDGGMIGDPERQARTIIRALNESGTGVTQLQQLLGSGTTGSMG